MIDTEKIKRDHPLPEFVRNQGIELKPAAGGRELLGACPFCDDASGHLYINPKTEEYYCHKCGAKGAKVIDFVMRQEAIGFREACEKLGGANGSNGHGPQLEEVCSYQYQDAQGRVTYEVVRYRKPDGDKTFKMRKGRDNWNMDGVTRVLYHLPEVIAAEEVWITEGEKDADNLRACGLKATTNAGGGNAPWLESYSESLRGKKVVICGDQDHVGCEHVVRLQQALSDFCDSIRTVILPSGFKDVSEMLEALKSDYERIEALERLRLDAKETGELAELDKCAFDFDHPPEEPKSVFTLNGMSIATAGNLVMVQGQIKAGKSAVLSAIIAGGICGDDGSIDLLGLECRGSGGKAIIHFDTEQSLFDYDHLVRTALKRAEVDRPPPCLQSFWLVMSRPAKRFAQLKRAMKRAHRKFGGIHFVLIDGIADLFPDVNDPHTSIENVEALQLLAIQYDTVVICVIHENPGSDTGKTRGHLGSHLARKAQSNLKIVKDADSEIITLFTEHSRNAHVSKAQGAKFKWDPELEMHSSMAAETEILKVTEKMRAELKEEVGDIFRHHETGLPFGDLIKRIMFVRQIQTQGAKSRWATYRKFALISKDGEGIWHP